MIRNSNILSLTSLLESLVSTNIYLAWQKQTMNSRNIATIFILIYLRLDRFLEKIFWNRISNCIIVVIFLQIPCLTISWEEESRECCRWREMGVRDIERLERVIRLITTAKLKVWPAADLQQQLQSCMCTRFLMDTIKMFPRSFISQAFVFGAFSDWQSWYFNDNGHDTSGNWFQVSSWYLVRCWTSNIVDTFYVVVKSMLGSWCQCCF